MATYIKRPSGWLAQVRLKGAPPQYETFPTKAQAVAWATQVEADIRHGRNSKKYSVNKTLNDALEKYRDEISVNKKGARWETLRINKFIRELDFVGKLIGEVSARDIAEWRDESLKRLKSSSVNREMNVLSGVFTVAKKEWQWCHDNPVQDVKRPRQPKSRDRLITEKEHKDMLEALGYIEGVAPITIAQKVAYAYLIALETAMRAGEICSIDKNSLHLKKKLVRLTDTKNGDRRDVPLSAKAIQLFSLVPNGLELTPQQLDSNWRKYSAGKVKNLHFHDTRHHAITNLAKKLNVLELARMVGIRNPKTLMVYFNESATTIAGKLDDAED